MTDILLITETARDILAEKGYPWRTFAMFTAVMARWLNRYVFKTYPSNYDCARCEDCGRNVHDFEVPDDLWMKVNGKENGVFCWDCFCERARQKGIHGLFPHVHKRKKW